jgi:low temperature requirement protein LtrA
VSSDQVEPAGGEEPETAEQEVERHASWAELFFDLVAVAAVASLAHVLATDLDWASLGLYAVLFLAAWLAWTTFMLYGNVSGSRTHVLRLLVGMFGLGVMAASVPGVAHAFLGSGEEGAHSTTAVTVFAVAYIATRVYGAQSWRRGEVLLDFPVAQHTFGVLPWIISLFTHPPVTIALWALGVALDLWLVLVVSGDDMLERYSSRMEQLNARGAKALERSVGERPRRGGRARRETTSEQGRMPTSAAATEAAEGRTNGGGFAGRGGRVREVLEPVPVVTDPGHLAERLGLFVIIVLGEGVVQVVHAASEALPEAGLFVAGLASFVLLAGMFGLSVQYGFAGVPHLREGAVVARVGLALHCVVTGVIATVSVGLASVVEHGNEPLDTGPRWLLCGAVAAYFLIAQLVAIVVLGREAVLRSLWISTGVVVPLLLGALGEVVLLPATVLTAVLALVVVGQVAVEARLALRRSTDGGQRLEAAGD